MDRVESLEALQIIRIPGWKQYNWLRHGFSTRQGGVSSVYGGDTLNLGWTKEDDPDRLRKTEGALQPQLLAELMTTQASHW
jgi:hypothetical protein